MPGLDATRPTINTRQIEPILFKLQQRLCQGPGLVVVNRERDERLPLLFFLLERFFVSSSQGRNDSPVFPMMTRVIVAVADDQEARLVVVAVLDALCQHIQTVDLGSRFAGNGCESAGRVLGYDLGALGRGRDFLALGAFEIGGEEGFALAKGLVVRVDALHATDIGQRLGLWGLWVWDLVGGRDITRHVFVGGNVLVVGMALGRRPSVTEEVVVDVNVYFAIYRDGSELRLPVCKEI